MGDRQKVGPTGEQLAAQYKVTQQRQRGLGDGGPGGDSFAEVQRLERRLMDLRGRRQAQAGTGVQAPQLAGLDRQIAGLELERAHLMQNAGGGGPGGGAPGPGPVRSFSQRPEAGFDEMDWLGSVGSLGRGGR